MWEVDLAQPDQADPTATINAIRGEVVGLQHLIDDLLHLARADAGLTELSQRPVDLDDIVLAEVRQQRMTSGTTVDSSGVSAAHLIGNAEQLTRAVRNLLTNAARHARQAVTVTLDENNDHIELMVADDGPGVQPEDRERIFERFTRVDDARSRGAGGTGLGLAITRDIIEGHGGQIHCDDHSSGGARFLVTLPRRPDGDRPAAGPSPADGGVRARRRR